MAGLDLRIKLAVLAAPEKRRFVRLFGNVEAGLGRRHERRLDGHPVYQLRLPDEASRLAGRALVVEDLKRVRSLL